MGSSNSRETFLWCVQWCLTVIGCHTKACIQEHQQPPDVANRQAVISCNKQATNARICMQAHQSRYAPVFFLVLVTCKSAMKSSLQLCKKKHHSSSNKKKRTFNGPALPDVAMNKNCSDSIIYLVISCNIRTVVAMFFSPKSSHKAVKCFSGITPKSKKQTKQQTIVLDTFIICIYTYVYIHTTSSAHH